MDGSTEDFSDYYQNLDSDNINYKNKSCSSNDKASNSDTQLYFVPYRWWKEAQAGMLGDPNEKKWVLYTATSGSSYGCPMKIIDNIFNSDLVFNLRREDDAQQNCENGEVGISGWDFALVHVEMWLQALKWHSESKMATKDTRGFSAAEDDLSDVYPLRLRLSVQQETMSLGVKISKKENASELFRRACKIFSVGSDLLRILDLSGQTTLLFVNDKNNLAKDCLRQSEQEVLLELQVYVLSDSMKGREVKKEDMGLQHSSLVNSSGGVSLKINGNGGSINSNSFRSHQSFFSGGPSEAGSLGLTGLQNLGNTCFMNSALQCFAHTPKLVDYFLGDYAKEINHDNPLGMDGEIALAFGDLLRKLWASGATLVTPRQFKSKLTRFAPQFGGFKQHDSQELLAFLLDGLHEDLNRVKCKPYMEAKDGEGRPDEEVSDEYWQNHSARNDSIIVDLFQGQYKSTLVCPDCKKVSVTFDPFMYLSLPLPSTIMRTMTFTVMNTNGNTLPMSFTISVPKHGKLEDMIRAISTACSLRVDETLLLAEIYNYRLLRFLEEPNDLLSLIRDEDRLIAYRFSKDTKETPLVIFTNQQLEEHCLLGKPSSNWKTFGIPLVARLYDIASGFNLHNLYLKLLNPFQFSSDDCLEDHDKPSETKEANGFDIDRASHSVENSMDINLMQSPLDAEFQFYLADEKGAMKPPKISLADPLVVKGESKLLNVIVCWSEKQIRQYDTYYLGLLPEVYKSGFFLNRSPETVSLNRCLEAFLQEEPLGPEDMWYCPWCKIHSQASKKLDLWKLPEILVIHLKRFSYSQFLQNKLETFVDFPIDDLDLSSHIAYREDKYPKRYELYAISNHYGSMGGGHYTAFVHHGGDRWYDFDDNHVHSISRDKIKTSAAYVLFYRRVVEE